MSSRLTRTRVLGAAVAIASALVLAGCSLSQSHKAMLYMLFDSSVSSSQLVREGYSEDAVLVGQSFCTRNKGGDIVLNLITAHSEEDSVFRTLGCPNGRNETDQAAKLLVFRATLQANVDEIVAMQSSQIGSDVVGAIVSGATQTFGRLKPHDKKYMVVYSDMQQFGGGVRQCVRHEGAEGASHCLRRYFAGNSQYTQSGALDGAAVFAIGVGKTVSGSLTSKEWQGYKSFWKTFFATEGGNVCWYSAAMLPIQTDADGTRSLDPNYFTPDCPPAL
jgi:hypothetical protein